MKQTTKLFLAVLMLANTAHAANWQTPAEAVQLAALENGDTTAPAPEAVTIAGQPGYFQVTADDVAKAVVQQMQQQGFKSDVKATLNPLPAPVIYAANHPLKLVVHGLQVDPDAQLWQAQAYIMADGKTETVKPVSGRYDAMQRVPVLTRQLRKGDLIERTDISLKTLPERQLRKDTITDIASMIGQSPTRVISPGRPVRMGEITQPTLIKKGQVVDMVYSTPYMSIRATGEALEDGAQGALIRLQNTKSQKAISGRVVAAGKVEVNSESSL